MKNEYEIGWRNFSLVYFAFRVNGDEFIEGNRREKCEYVFKFHGNQTVEVVVKKDGNVFNLIKESQLIISVVESVRGAMRFASIGEAV